LPEDIPPVILTYYTKTFLAEKTCYKTFRIESIAATKNDGRSLIASTTATLV
jgi:hypothetical protein